MVRSLAANPARSAREFAAVARNEATTRSDVELLVDFNEDASGVDQRVLPADLEDQFGRRVNVTEQHGVRWLVRPQILFEAVTV
ncbi:MAG: nucleotidyltransferase [Thermoplasmata archaeon]